jgi:hypothetical protein
MLPCSIAAQLFEAISRGNPQIIERRSIVEHSQFAQGNLLNFWWQLS